MPALLAAVLLHLPATAAPTSGPPETTRHEPLPGARTAESARTRGLERADSAVRAPAASQKTIPWTDVGATASAQYSGDGLTVTPTREGARLRCVFQHMEGEATREGLWLSSTATNQAKDRFRVMAAKVGRGEEFGVRRQSAAATPLWKGGLDPIGESESGVALHFPPQSKTLPREGEVQIAGSVVRFVRPGLIEEYSVSMDGVRQDFIVEGDTSNIEHRTSNFECPTGELRVELSVTGAIVEPIPGGARLVLEKSGREIAYSRLKVTDATGRELPARMELLGGAAAPAAPVNASLTGRVRAGELFDEGVEQDTRGTCAPQLAILVDDADAVYPVRIDPTFSDANWISMGGMSGIIYEGVADASGNLYIGGNFTMVMEGGVTANRIAKWDGNEWSALGSGLNGEVATLVVSGSDLYAGGKFTSAGGIAANYIAKWDGSSWSALGPGVSRRPISSSTNGDPGRYDRAFYLNYDSIVSALAVSGNDLYAGGSFTSAGGVTANGIAKWNGTSWSALDSGMGGDHHYGYPQVFALAVSGSDLYAGGEFTMAGGTAANRIAKWNGLAWSSLGSGLMFHEDRDRLLPYPPAVSALVVSGGDLYAGGWFPLAGGSEAQCIAKWNGNSWSALGSGMNHGVSALAVLGSELYAGGGFHRAGGKVSAYMAKAIVNPPVLTLVHNASGTNFIRFSGVPGTAYHLQRASSLAGPWPNIATNTAPAGGRIEVGDGSPPPARAFYRVVEP